MEEKQIPEFSQPIAKVDYMDGCKIYFEDDSFVSCRFSGTEPLLRLFAEASTKEQAEEYVKAFHDFLEL